METRVIAESARATDALGTRGVEQAPAQSRQAWLVGGAKLAIAAILLGALIHYEILDLAVVVNLLRHPYTLAASVALITVGVNIPIVRWHILLSAQGVHIDFRRLWMISYMGYFATTFLPGAAGGDILRLYYASREAPGQVAAVVFCTAFDRAIGLYALFFAVLIPLAANISAVLSRGAFIMLAAVVAGVIAAPPVALMMWKVGQPAVRRASPMLQRSRTVWRLLAGLGRMVEGYRRKGATLAFCILIGVLSHIFGLAAIVVVALSLDSQSLGRSQYALAGAVSIVSGLLPITPGGLGIGEGVFDQVCRLLAGNPAYHYAAALLLWRALYAFATLPGLVAYVFLRRKSPTADSVST